MANKKIDAATKDLTKILKVPFKRKRLLESAIVHPSARSAHDHRRLDHFDRLEFFGDAILNFVICKQIYLDFPDASEGLLSRIRSILVSRKLLSKIAHQLKLHQLAVLGNTLKRVPLAQKTKLLADIFEALLGAMYFDQGLPKTEKFILQHFKPFISTQRLFRLDPNPKSALQEVTQKRWKKLPTYKHRETKQGVKVTVNIGSKRKAHAIARTRQLGEEKAARLLLKSLRQETLSPKISKKSRIKKSSKLS